MTTPKKTLKTLENRVGGWGLLSICLLYLTAAFITARGYLWLGLGIGLLAFLAIKTTFRFLRHVERIQARQAAGLARGSRPRTQVPRSRRPAPSLQSIEPCTRHRVPPHIPGAQADFPSDYTPH